MTPQNGTLPYSDVGQSQTLNKTVAQTGEMIALSSDRTVALSPPPGYELLDELGRGGMGVVYKARDVNLGRFAAIKMILGGSYTNPVAQARFLIEAEVIGMLQHPYVVQVYGYGQHAGQPYFALEFIDGGNLAEKTAAGFRFTPREAAEFVLKLSEAMAAAHGKGIVHRDLKPGNILLTADGLPKITDFGLAKHGETELTATGAVMGTPAYMSPEQAAGRTNETGTASDVYSLGVILYELLAGKTPFRGETMMETMKMVMEAEPERVRSISANIPRDLETICMHCLKKSPGQRYPTAAALASDLRAYLSDQPISVRPTTWAERMWRKAARHPALSAMSALLVLMTVIVPPLLWSYQKRMQATETARQALAERAEQEEKARIAAEEAAETQKYFANFNKVLRKIAIPRPGWTWEAREALEAAAKSTATKDLLEFRTAVVDTETAVDLRRVGIVAPVVRHSGAEITCSPDGKWLAIADKKVGPTRLNCRVQLLDVKTLKVTHDLSYPNGALLKLGAPEGTSALTFSPDNKWLVCGTRWGSIHRLKMDEIAKGFTSWSGPEHSIDHFAFDSTSKILFAIRRDAGLTRREIETGKVTHDIKTEFLGDNLRLAYISNLPRRYAGKDKDTTFPALLVANHGRNLAVHPDTLVAIPDPFAYGNGQSPTIRPLSQVKYDRATRSIYSQTSGGITRFDVWSGLPTQEFFVNRKDPPTRHYTASPDGDFVATMTKQDKLLLARTVDARTTCEISIGNTYDLAFTPNSNKLFLATDEGVLGFELHISQLEGTSRKRSYPLWQFNADSFANNKQIDTLGGVNADAFMPIYEDFRPTDRNRAVLLPFVVWSDNLQFLADTPKARGPILSLTGEQLLAVDRKSGSITPLPNPTQKVTAIAIARTGQTFWTAEGPTVYSRSAKDGAILHKWSNLLNLASGRGNVRAISPGEKGILIAIRDGPVAYLKSPTLEPISSWVVREEALTAATQFPDDSIALVGTESGTIAAFQLPEGQEIITVKNSHEGRILSMAVHPKRDLIATAGSDGQVTLWSWKENRMKRIVHLRPTGTLPVRQMAFTPKSNRLLILHEEAHGIENWNLDAIRKRFQELMIDW